LTSPGRKVSPFVQGGSRGGDDIRFTNAAFVIVNPSESELIMEFEASSSALCQCANCPGSGCDCGCQSVTQAVSEQPVPQHCTCGPRCGCDAAKQGCLCD
jgi:hypothetical protein